MQSLHGNRHLVFPTIKPHLRFAYVARATGSNCKTSTTDSCVAEPGTTASSIRYLYERTLTWSKVDLTVWREYTHVQRQFDDQMVGDEAYTVYSLIAAEGWLPPCP